MQFARHANTDLMITQCACQPQITFYHTVLCTYTNFQEQNLWRTFTPGKMFCETKVSWREIFSPGFLPERSNKQ